MDVRALVQNSIAIAGSASELAETLGVSRQAVWRWSNLNLDPEAGQIWKMLCLCYRGKMHQIAPRFDAYIKHRDEMQEFR